MVRRGAPPLIGLAGLLALGGSAQASSPSERQIQELFWAVTWFALLVSVIVYGALFYFLWRYRQSASPPRRISSEGPSEGNRKVEMIWTAFPIVILVIITLLSFPVLLYTDTMPPADVTIHVTGSRFYWTFTYEEPGVDEQNWTTTFGEAWFQRGIVVHFLVTSNDTIHSFALPQLGVKIDAIPHKTNVVWTRVDVAGDYLTQCAEFCGVGHHDMRATIHVFEPEAGRKPYGPVPSTLPFADVELRGFGSPPWSIQPPEIDATDGEPLRLRIWNNNSQDYTFRIDSPIDREVLVPAFAHAWLNTTINVSSDTQVPYGPTDLTARGYGMNGTLNVTVAILIELDEYTITSPLILEKVSVKFLLRNVGSQAHNFAMGGVYETVQWAGLIPGGQSVVIGPFDLDQDASGQYWCAVPGHRSLGMEGNYKVGAGGAAATTEAPLFEMAATTFAVGVPVTLAYVVRHARRRDE